MRGRILSCSSPKLSSPATTGWESSSGELVQSYKLVGSYLKLCWAWHSSAPASFLFSQLHLHPYGGHFGFWKCLCFNQEIYIVTVPLIPFSRPGWSYLIPFFVSSVNWPKQNYRQLESVMEAAGHGKSWIFSSFVMYCLFILLILTTPGHQSEIMSFPQIIVVLQTL